MSTAGKIAAASVADFKGENRPCLSFQIIMMRGLSEQAQIVFTQVITVLRHV
jgi:hypothetical protein